MSRILSTRQVAERCGVTPRTVARWVDAGALVATYTTGGHRRIREDDLRDFMDTRRSLMAMDRTTPGLRVAVISRRAEIAGLFRSTAVALNPNTRVRLATPDLAGGLVVADHRPHLVVIDGSNDPDEACRLAEAIRGAPNTEHALIAITVHTRQDLPVADHVLVTPLFAEAIRDALRSADEKRRAPA